MPMLHPRPSPDDLTFAHQPLGLTSLLVEAYPIRYQQNLPSGVTVPVGAGSGFKYDVADHALKGAVVIH